MPLLPATRLGTYEILGLLGAGGMGEVYRAKDLRLCREVAVKVLPLEVAASPDRLARFEREARTVAGLNHPNIVTLHSVEDQDGIRFITMELVEGRSLSSLIIPSGLPLSRVLDLSIPIADALVAAHERGVIHRDLKPGNVMVTREGRVKVLDFGLAKIVGGAGSAPADTSTVTAGTPRTAPGVAVGTLPYMAPEQLRGDAVDARTDLFALGIILFELATGRRPFAGGTTADLASSILRDTPESLTRVRADLPHDLERIVSRCLEKNPRERAQSALDVYNELRRVKHGAEQGGLVVRKKPGAKGVASIAVLPFVNRSASAEDEYFSDGLADELLNVLAKIKGLRVLARASSFHFKGKDVPLGEIGGALNVATLLDGSVRKVGNRMRISVQLVKVSDGCHLWSETYDRTLEDIFAVQDDIARSVVKELRTTLLGEDPEAGVKADVADAVKGRTTDPEAHRLYLLAQHLIQRYTREDMAKAAGYLEEALKRDPEFALAWAALGRVYAIEADSGWVPVSDGYERARAAVERALAQEPALAEGHARKAWIQVSNDWDWLGAQASYAEALELAPRNASVLRGAGVLAYNLGHLERAVELHRRALEQDPLSSSCYHNLGFALYAARRFSESEEAYRRALELAPQSAGTHAYLSLALLAQGRGEESLAELMPEPENVLRLWALAIVHHADSRAADSDAALRELVEKHAEDGAYQIAEARAARGERDAAFEWLERAYAQRDTGVSEMKASLHLASLHGDPRWRAFIQKMGFAE